MGVVAQERSVLRLARRPRGAEGSDHLRLDGYYKGPDYTEYPVTHAFYITGTEEQTFNFTFYGEDNTFGNIVLMPRLYEVLADKGVDLRWSQKCVRLLRDGDGPIAGAVTESDDGALTRYEAGSVVIAAGDYGSNKEMIQCYAPFQNFSTDMYVYIPPEANQGELHQQAMWVGAAMQKSEPHASVTHLDFGAASYGFLHVNGLGQRFKNEDVNTQSKSITKAFQPTKQAYTIYDANGLAEVKRQVDAGIGGGLQWGQLTQRIGGEYSLEAQQAVLEGEVEQGLTFESDTLEGLAEQIGCDPAVFVATVERYNELCVQGERCGLRQARRDPCTDRAAPLLRGTPAGLPAHHVRRATPRSGMPRSRHRRPAHRGPVRGRLVGRRLLRCGRLPHLRGRHRARATQRSTVHGRHQRRRRQRPRADTEHRHLERFPRTRAPLPSLPAVPARSSGSEVSLCRIESNRTRGLPHISGSQLRCWSEGP